MQLLKSRRSRSHDERGAILILTALMIILLLMIAAFATDLAAWYRQGQEQQRAADVAALNSVQAYDSELKSYLVTKGKDSFADLTGAEQDEVTILAVQDAVDAMIGSLAAGGTTIQYSPTIDGTYLTDPLLITVPLTATDGSTITMTFDRIGVSFDVTVERPGEQYFSTVLNGSSPTLSRSASAKVANCNADCSRDIVLDPPFQGFTAAAKGDGYRPLVGENGKVYAVNHHAAGSNGSIVCMDSSLKPVARCSGWDPPPNNQYYTHNKSDDYIDNARDKIYFPAYRSSTGQVGIACISTTSSHTWCPFTPLANYSRPGSGTAYIPITGLWVFPGATAAQDRMFSLTQDGQIHCIYIDSIGTSNPRCTGYPKATAVSGKSGLPSMTSSSRYPRMVLGEVINGKIYSYHDNYSSSSGTTPYGWFACWNPATDSSCSGFGAVNNNSLYDDRSREIKFTRHNTTGSPTGFCIAPRTSSASEFRHTCVSLSGSIQGQIPNLNSTFADFPYRTGSDPSLYGEGFTFDGRRLFFGQVDNNTSMGNQKIYCYDWELQTPCPNGSTPGSFVGEQVYGMVKISDECALGIGHSSTMYSFSVNSLSECTGTTVNLTIYPCLCADGVETRFGVLALPPGLQSQLLSAVGTVTPSPSSGLPTTTHDLLASDWDLSSYNGQPSLELEIAVESKKNGAGDLLWTTPFTANLALTTQPTLAE